MKILFNPSTVPVPEYNFDGKRVNIGGLSVKGFKQYPDPIAEDMEKRWEFLQVVPADQVETMMKKAKEEDYTCTYCEFTTHARIALAGHLRAKHKDETGKNPAVDPELVPMDTSKKIIDAHQARSFRQAIEDGTDLPPGIDRDGVFWYGDGVTEENREFRKVRPIGQGHFKG